MCGTYNYVMASIYKPTGRRKYYISYRDPGTGRRLIVPGYVDRDATRALATDIERVAARRAAGIEPRAPTGKTPADYEAELIPRREDTNLRLPEW